MERIKIIIETNSMEGEIGNFLPIEPTRIATRKKNWNVPPGNRREQQTVYTKEGAYTHQVNQKGLLKSL